jgi:hypothetical protein
MLDRSWRGLRRGRLAAVTELLLPYHLFAVTLPGRGKTFLAIDALDGRLDLHSFERVPVPGREATLAVGDFVSATLSADLARERLVDQMLRRIFLDGFFKQHRGSIETEYLGLLYLPYWVGIFERHGNVKLEVIDAYRARFEGEKMRQVVATILSSRDTASPSHFAACAS